MRDLETRSGPVGEAAGRSPVGNSEQPQVLDRQSFERLVEANYQSLFKFCKRLFYLSGSVNIAEDAENLLQDVLLKAWKARNSLMNIDGFQGWVKKIAKNALTDTQRGYMPRRNLDYRLAEQLDAILSVGLSPEAGAIKKQEGEIARACLERLTPTEKQLLGLRLSGNLGYQEIARIMVLPDERAPKRQFNRLLVKLRKDYLDRISKK